MQFHELTLGAVHCRSKKCHRQYQWGLDMLLPIEEYRHVTLHSILVASILVDYRVPTWMLTISELARIHHHMSQLIHSHRPSTPAMGWVSVDHRIRGEVVSRP